MDKLKHVPRGGKIETFLTDAEATEKKILASPWPLRLCKKLVFR